MALVLAVLVVCYFYFSRVLITYHVEQTLYCLAENQANSRCRERLKNRIQRLLPFGRIEQLELSKPQDKPHILLIWRLKDFPIKIDRTLNLRASQVRRAL
ncbi:MAG: hypothetical protein AB7F86_04180 [Bdellovibrionales bacterium]